MLLCVCVQASVSALTDAATADAGLTGGAGEISQPAATHGQRGNLLL